MVDIGALGLPGTASAADQSSTKLAENFDDFLTILVTQLQNQDPLSPMESNEFTQQLVQFTGVEQSITTNKNLEKLLTAYQAGQFGNSVSYLGKTIEAPGDTSMLQNGRASWNYNLAGQSANTQINIVDASGKTVFTALGQNTPGSHPIHWDGRNDQGVQQPDDVYTLVIGAVDAAGDPVKVGASTVGRVTSVDTSKGVVELKIGDVTIPITAVTSVREPNAA